MEKDRNNPYSILIIAFIFSIPGVAMLCHRGPSLLFAEGISSLGSPVPVFDDRHIVTEQDVHIFGICMVVIAMAIAAFYFHLRQEIRREEQNPIRRKPR